MLINMARYRITENKLRGLIRETIISVLNENTDAWQSKVSAFINGLKTGNVEYVNNKTIGVPIDSYGNNTNDTEMVTYSIGSPTLFDEYTTPTSYKLDDRTFKYINDLSSTYFQVLTTNFKASHNNVMPYGYMHHGSNDIRKRTAQRYKDTNYGDDYSREWESDFGFQNDNNLPIWIGNDSLHY